MQLQFTTGPVALQIPLRNHYGTVRAYALIDADDLPLVSEHRWHLDGLGYAASCSRVNGRTVTVKLHRLLLGLVRGDGMEADHINRDRLDNRRANLRVLPKAGRPNTQNCPNYSGSRSRFRGVSWDATYGKNGSWVAKIRIDGRQRRVGGFASEEAAGEAARLARLRLMPYATD